MRIGSLFSGIGGLELGLEWAGVGHTVWQVERDPYCLAVLAQHWPNAERFTDVLEVGAHNLPPVDVICGGFPCQDISDAGKRAGITGARSGLWSEFARLIRELRPRYVVVENVRALLVRGFDSVLGDLAAAGYDAEWDVLSAADVGAPHLRHRVFIIAWPAQGRVSDTLSDELRIVGEWHREQRLESRSAVARGDGESGSVADSDGARSPHDREGDARGERFAWGNSSRAGGPRAIASVPNADLLEDRRLHAGRQDRQAPGVAAGCGEDVPDADGERGLVSPERRLAAVEVAGSDGGTRGESRRDWWTVEPDVGRVAHGIPARVDRLRALGNAVVPQCAEVIGRRLIEIDQQLTA